MSQSTESFWRCRDKRIPLGRRTAVMGVVNITPDSFSDGGQYESPDAAIDHALRLIDEGADILDFGAESTRPGAPPVPEEEEIRRLRGPVEAVRARTKIPISIDTVKSGVARAMLDLGADIINDVSGLVFDPEMAEIAAKAGAGVVVMHTRGTPETMQTMTSYNNVVADVIRELSDRASVARQDGIDPEHIVLDPGIGFAKTAQQNLIILKRLREFQSLESPLLVGVSRKSFIATVQGGSTPDDRLEGTAGAVAAAVWNGAAIVRVHDVKAMRRVVDVIDAIRNA